MEREDTDITQEVRDGVENVNELGPDTDGDKSPLFTVDDNSSEEESDE